MKTTNLLILSFLPCGGALLARLRFWDWRAWFFWAAISFTYFLGIWIYKSQEIAFHLVVLSSFLGFVAPDLWEALSVFLRQPRNLGWILVGASIVYLLYQPQLLGSIMAIFIIILGFRIIIRPFFSQRQQRR